jgi:hypothetical protein
MIMPHAADALAPGAASLFCPHTLRAPLDKAESRMAPRVPRRQSTLEVRPTGALGCAT